MKTISALTIALICALPAAAQDTAGRFDYYVLALSWSPSWCKLEGDPDDEQCRPGARHAFVVHGLWPQYERGYPRDCPTTLPGPSRRETRQMANVMGSSGLAWHQWRKHGRCTGLTAQDYFRETRNAYASITIPQVLEDLPRDISTAAKVIEDAFIEENPNLTRDGITVSCRDRTLQEVKICLSKDLQPRSCSPEIRRDCTGSFLLPAPS